MRTDKLTMRDPEMAHVFGRTAMDTQPPLKNEVGDMVWGKVKSHPWWPGQIFDEAFALPIVNETKREGHLLVAFFGDDTFAWFDPIELIPFDPDYMEKSKQTNAKAFLDAVQDAENVTRKRAALGLSCCCRNPSNFQGVGVKGFFLVEVEGYGPATLYTEKQIESARDGFRPAEMLCFLRGLALMPCRNLKKGVDWIKKVAIVLAYRKAVFEEFDKTYVDAFGVGLESTVDSSRILDLQEKLPLGASLSWSPKTPGASAGTKCFSRPTSAKRKKEFTELDVSRVHSDQGLRKNFSSLSIYEKESTVVAGDHVEKDITSKEAVTDDKMKRKMGFKLEEGLQHSRKRHMSMKVETSEGDEYGKSCETGLCCRDNILLGRQGSEIRASYTEKNWIFLHQVPQLHSNLLAIALNPFHGVEVEHTALAAVLQFFQRVRSFTFMKNFVMSPSTEFELIENNYPESLTCNVTQKSQEVPSASKPPKKRLKPDDCEIFGQNDSNSCEKEGMPEKKKLIKLSKHNALSAKGKVKERSVTDHEKILIKKPKTSRKSAEPTMLILIFPPRSALPSVSELKARFARFGPFDSVPRLFWKSSTCRVVFKYKSDAHLAYGYAARNKSLFGNTKVDCFLQPLDVPASELQKPCKHHGQHDLEKFPWFETTETSDYIESLKSIVPEGQQLCHSMFQPKSCLKKSQGAEFGRGPLQMKPHVKFQLNEDQSSRKQQLIVNSSVKSSKFSATAEIPGNWQVFISQSPPALHPLLNQIKEALMNHGLDHFVAACNARYEAEARKNCNSSMSAPSTFNVDISSQMLNLMNGCSEIISDLKSWLGYVPIHL